MAGRAQALDVWNGINWNGVNWNGINWNGVNWNGVNWNGANWNGVNWNGINWNGVNWNGVNWNGVNWNGVNWNGVDWNSVDWNRIDWLGAETSLVDWTSVDWQGLSWTNVHWPQVSWSSSDWNSENFPGIASDWAGLGWFMRGTDPLTGERVGTFVVTNPHVRSWVYDASNVTERDQRLQLLGKLVTGSACAGWPVWFGEVDGQPVGWQGSHCLAPSFWGLGPQHSNQKRLLSAFIISLFNATTLEVSLRAPVPGLASTAGERNAFSVPQACYSGDLFRSTPLVRAHSIRAAEAEDAAFDKRACRVDVTSLDRLERVSLQGDRSFIADPCAIEWSNADQEVPLSGYESGDAEATIVRCDSANTHGEVDVCRTFSFEKRAHNVHGPIQIAVAVEDYPTVCAYLAPE